MPPGKTRGFIPTRKEIWDVLCDEEWAGAGAGAMRHRLVDRVPVICQLAIGDYLLNTDVSPVELWFTSEGFARAVVTLQRRYGFDGILSNLLATNPDWLRRVERIETNQIGVQRLF